MSWVKLPVAVDKLMLFGGDAGGQVFLNDLYVMEFSKGKVICTPAKVSGDLPPPVCLHTATVVGSKLYVFGGYDGVECFNHLFVLSPDLSYGASEKFLWKKVNAAGDVPSKRAGHSAIAVGSKIMVFGGKDSNGAYLGDSYLLNVDTFTWVRTNPKPPSQTCKARAYHTACRFGNLVHIFGGAEEGGIPSFDTWTWNIETYAWTKLVVMGEVPAGLYSHVAIELGRLMIIFGGYNGQGNLSGKTFILNVDKRSWKGVVLKNNAKELAPLEDPAPRARHCVALVTNKVFVFGGIKPDTENTTGPPKISYCNELMTLYGFDKIDEAANAATPKQSMLNMPSTSSEAEQTFLAVPSVAVTVPAAVGGGAPGSVGAMKRPGPAAMSGSGSPFGAGASTAGVPASASGGRAALGNSGNIAPVSTAPRPVPGSSPLASSNSSAASSAASSPQKTNSIRRNMRRSISVPSDAKETTDMEWTGNDVFEIEAKLAEGPRGTVYRGVKQVQSGPGALLAIKEVAGAANDELYKAELDAAKKCKHGNIASYYGTVVQDNSLWVVMDYVHGGSVRDLLDTSQQPFTEEMISHVAGGALRGLVYLHAANVVHRAVRASNLMLTEDGTVKLSDFGVSRPVQQDSDATTPARLAPALWYAPEVMLSPPRWSDKCDVWALGVTVIEMADLLPPHCNAGSVLQAMRLIQTKASPSVANPNKWSIELTSFVAKCVLRTASDRPSAQDLAQSEPLLRKAKSVPEQLSSRIAEYVAQRKQREAEEMAADAAVDATTGAQDTLSPPTSSFTDRSSRANASLTTVYTTPEIENALAAQSIAEKMDPNVLAYLADQLEKFRDIMRTESDLKVEMLRQELLKEMTGMAQQVTARDNKIKQLEAEIDRLKRH